jgi:hypothetical protein
MNSGPTGGALQGETVGFHDRIGELAGGKGSLPNIEIDVGTGPEPLRGPIGGKCHDDAF